MKKDKTVLENLNLMLETKIAADFETSINPLVKKMEVQPFLLKVAGKVTTASVGEGYDLETCVEVVLSYNRRFYEERFQVKKMVQKTFGVDCQVKTTENFTFEVYFKVGYEYKGKKLITYAMSIEQFLRELKAKN